jgi:phage terminase large subunit-like protein
MSTLALPRALPPTLPPLADLLSEQRRRKQNKIDTMFLAEGPTRRSLYPKHMEVIAATATSNQVAFIAANKIGKSELGCYCLATWLTGIYPDWWHGRIFPKPVTAWCVGEKNSVVRDSLQLKLLGPLAQIGTGLVRGSCIERATRKSGLSDAIDTLHVRHVSGGTSTLRMKSYEEQRPSFQGTDVDIVIFDEEPPLDVYVESMLRTMVKQGIGLLLFTPLNGYSAVVSAFLDDHTG